MYIGKIQGLSVETATDAPNHSVICFGASGTGKTCRMHQIELAEAEKGGTVIVLDMHQTHEPNQIFELISHEYEEKANRISVLQDGINMNFLKISSENQAELVVTVNSVLAALSGPFSFGTKQTASLREAIIFGICNLNQFTDSMTAIGAGLQRQNTEASQCVFEKLWTLLYLQVFHGDRNIQEGKINIISLTGMDILTQEILGELILSFLWKNAMSFGQYLKKNITVVLDEFQGLSLRKGSTLRSMLCEGRKFHLGLLMATQSINIFKREEQIALDQAGTKLFFRPGDNEVRKMARQLGLDSVDKHVKTLSDLRIGQSVVNGKITVNGNKINRAVVLE